jgi:hypothetical protein
MSHGARGKMNISAAGASSMIQEREQARVGSMKPCAPFIAAVCDEWDRCALRSSVLGLELCSNFRAQLHSQQNQNKERIINKLSNYLVRNQHIVEKSG